MRCVSGASRTRIARLPGNGEGSKVAVNFELTGLWRHQQRADEQHRHDACKMQPPQPVRLFKALAKSAELRCRAGDPAGEAPLPCRGDRGDNSARRRPARRRLRKSANCAVAIRARCSQPRLRKTSAKRRCRASQRAVSTAMNHERLEANRGRRVKIDPLELADVLHIVGIRDVFGRCACAAPSRTD